LGKEGYSLEYKIHIVFYRIESNSFGLMSVIKYKVKYVVSWYGTVLEVIRRNGPIQALVLVPTRELALQVTNEINKFAKYTGSPDLG
jgi:superfamily II DNA/RNA helicase